MIIAEGRGGLPSLLVDPLSLLLPREIGLDKDMRGGAR